MLSAILIRAVTFAFGIVVCIGCCVLLALVAAFLRFGDIEED